MDIKASYPLSSHPLLNRLLNYACSSHVAMPTAEALLNNEMTWLKSARDCVLRGGSVDDALLEGHLGVTRELLAFQSADKKYFIGCKPGGINLIKVLHREVGILHWGYV